MKRIHPRALTPLLLALGCQGSVAPADFTGPGLLEQGMPIVAISRELPAEVVSRRDALIENRVQALKGPESFYLAINRADLNERFFLSLFVKVLEPGGVDDGAAASLGTRVVTFRVQNNKLFMFDVRDNRASSDSFDPTLVLEAYPLVQGFPPFKVLSGNNNYVLFDPAAGMNRFNPLISDAVEGGQKPRQFKVDLSYMQAFRQIADGATYEQVITGTVEDATESFGRDWAVLGMSLRRYAESPGFERFPSDPELPDHYYGFEEHRERNTGAVFSFYEHWNIRQGMKPIQWVLSRHWLDLQAELPRYDWVGAARAGVETWNEAFGFPALQTRMANPQDSFAEDDKNFLIFDRDPSIGYAFASSRINPNTGEVRGASVYFGGVWIQAIIDLLDPPPPMSNRPAVDRRVPRLRLGWSGLRPQALCRLDLEREARKLLADANLPSPKERVELFVKHTIAHEIGHTLGLQHNFKGSLDPMQSSVMEYVLDEETHLRSNPGPYDIDAIKYLYGLASEPPRQAFCQEGDLDRDPTCATYDTSDEPLGKYWAPFFQSNALALLRGEDPPRLGLNGLAAFLRAGEASDQVRAWEAMSAPFEIGVDVSMEEAAHPGYTARLNQLQDMVLERLFFADDEDRGDVIEDPEISGPALTAFTADLKNTLINSDKIRNWTVRRTAVDVLKKMQVQAAYETLLSAREILTASRASLSGAEATLTDDLLARIEAMIRPYFTN
jgi:hypothetical protein